MLRIENFQKFDLVTARAVSVLSSVLELSSPLLALGGYFLAYKSKLDEVELKDAEYAAEVLGFKLFLCKEFFLSDGVTKRHLYLYQKIKESQIDLPRRVGVAQKRPLSLKK